MKVVPVISVFCSSECRIRSQVLIKQCLATVVPFGASNLLGEGEGGRFSVAVGWSLSSTGFAVNFSPPACADVGHDSGMDNGPSQTDPQTSKIEELTASLLT